MSTREYESVPIQCQRTRAHLLGDLALELHSEDDYSALADHLESCPRCLKLVEVQQSDWCGQVDEKLRLANTASCTLSKRPTHLHRIASKERIAFCAAGACAATVLVAVLLFWPVERNRGASTKIAEARQPEEVLEDQTEPRNALRAADSNEQRAAPVIALRAQSGFAVAQRDESSEIPFYWILPASSDEERN